jgi:hypothetical protein
MKRFGVIAILGLAALGANARADELAKVTRACGKPVQIIEEPNQGRRLWRSMVFEPVPGRQVKARFFALAVSGPWYYELDGLEGLLSKCSEYKAHPPVHGVPGQPYQDSDGTWHRVVAFDCPGVVKNFNQIAPAKDGPWKWDAPGTVEDPLDCPTPLTAEGQRAKDCPRGIRAGMSRDQVYACLGEPDHTNSDLSTDQLVYPNDTYVYINRATGRVEDVQWTH